MTEMKLDDIFKVAFMKRNSMVCLGKIYNEQETGPCCDTSKPDIYSRHDRKYFEYRFRDEVSKRIGYAADLSCYYVKVRDKNHYMIVCYVKKDCKKHKVLNDMGFVVLKEAC